jgi:hypothetical protein
MAEHVSDRDRLLAVLRELGPDARDDGIGIEPVELEPLDVEEGPLPPRAPIHFRPSWIPAVAAVVAIWIVVAVVTRSDDGKAGAPSPTTGANAPPNAVSSSLPPGLLAALRGVGSGRFAVVVNSELHVADANAGTDVRVDLRVGPLWIESQNGSALVVRENRTLLLIGTDPISVEQLPDDLSPIATLEPGHWWIERPEYRGIIQRDGDGPVQQIPVGVQLVAAVDGGLLASTGDAYALWDQWNLRPLPFRGAFLDATPRVIALSNGCPGSSCVIDIDDLKRGTTMRLGSDAADKAAFSPDGSHLAVAAAFYVTIFDTKWGRSIMLPRRNSSPTVAPFTWTSNGELLVLTPSGIAVADADGSRNRTIADGGVVQQIVALR